MTLFRKYIRPFDAVFDGEYHLVGDLQFKDISGFFLSDKLFTNIKGVINKHAGAWLYRICSNNTNLYRYILVKDRQVIEKFVSSLHPQLARRKIEEFINKLQVYL